MKKKIIILSVVFSVLLVIIIIIAKNFDSLVEEYHWHKVDTQARQINIELLDKIKSGKQLTASEIDRITIYYHLTSNNDEGIRVLNDLLQHQDHYMIYLGLFQLSAEEAIIHDSWPLDMRRSRIQKSLRYLALWFKKVPDKALAYYTRSQSYAHLGCKKMALSDMESAIQESKKMKVVMISDGVYIDQNKFTAAVNKDFAEVRKIKGPCLVIEPNRAK
jgi:hypothetical protein